MKKNDFRRGAAIAMAGMLITAALTSVPSLLVVLDEITGGGGKL